VLQGPALMTIEISGPAERAGFRQPLPQAQHRLQSEQQRLLATEHVQSLSKQ